MAASFGTACAEEATLNVGYQPIVEPSRVPQADGTYGQVMGVKISWQIAANELVAVIGRTGSGKTSLLNLAVDGEPIHGPNADRAVVFQDDALIPSSMRATTSLFPSS